MITVLAALIFSLTANYQNDYVTIAVDLYSKSGECRANGIIANGVVYFLTGGEQIAHYTDIDTYLQDGLQYIDNVCN